LDALFRQDAPTYLQVKRLYIDGVTVQ
jgi:hypothetical protein